MSPNDEFLHDSSGFWFPRDLPHHSVERSLARRHSVADESSPKPDLLLPPCAHAPSMLSFLTARAQEVALDWTVLGATPGCAARRVALRPIMFGTVLAVLVASGTLGCLLSAIRVTRVDPTTVFPTE